MYGIHSLPGSIEKINPDRTNRTPTQSKRATIKDIPQKCLLLSDYVAISWLALKGKTFFTQIEL